MYVVRMPSMTSSAGSALNLAARAGTPTAPASGTYGTAASTASSHSLPSSRSCCRLNGALSGSRRFGKIFVIARTRIRGGYTSARRVRDDDGVDRLDARARRVRVAHELRVAVRERARVAAGRGGAPCPHRQTEGARARRLVTAVVARAHRGEV